MKPASARLTELDWVRIAAFGLLILYHCGMYYVSWDWHVKSPRLVPGLESAMLLLNPWRMPLLFVVSGAATGLMLRGGGLAFGARSARLLLPLLFGMAVVVVPQAYLEAVHKYAYGGSFVDFLGLYYRGYHGFCREGRCLSLPTWNHLWFLAYLWAYTAVLAGVLAVAGAAWADAPAWRQLTRGARLLWLPCLLLALYRQWLFPSFPPTNDLVHDAYNHAFYATTFVLGLVLFGRRDDGHGAWAAAQRWRWWALGLALLAHALQRGALMVWGQEHIAEAGWAALRVLSGVKQWLPIVAVLGFARLHLAGRDGPARRWFTEAVFPFYVVHQTVIVVAAPLLAAQAWPLALEMAALVSLTAAACVLSFVLVRRVPGLRSLFGVQMSKA
jgi:hypothetical protein